MSADRQRKPKVIESFSPSVIVKPSPEFVDLYLSVAELVHNVVSSALSS
jgi:hypothetical protein